MRQDGVGVGWEWDGWTDGRTKPQLLKLAFNCSNSVNNQSIWLKVAKVTSCSVPLHRPKFDPLRLLSLFIIPKPGLSSSLKSPFKSFSLYKL